MNLISTLSKTVHCFLHKLFLAFCIKLFSDQHYLKNCSFSFSHELLSVHYLKNSSLFSHITPNEIVISKSKAKSECFSMFEFHNNQIYFSVLIKSVSKILKFAICTSFFAAYSNQLTAFMKFVFCNN